MTNEIKLLLGEEKYEVDISSTQPISINYSIRDIKDYSKRKASFTKPFSILRTKKIDKIFKSLYNVNSIDFDLSKTIPAIIKKNTGILKGNMTITDITSNSYEVVVSTNNVNIFNELGDDLIVGNDTNLKDVQIPGLFNITRQGIRDSWANYTGSNDFIFPVVDHGNDISSLSKIENNYPILPSISAKYLFDNIIKSKGYTYSLSTIIDKYLSKMYIPYNNNYDLLGEDTKVAEYYMLPLVGPSDPDIRLSYRSINDVIGGYYYIDDKFNNITTAGRYANEDPEFRFNTRYFGNYAINIKLKLKYTGTLPPDALGKKGLELSLTCHGGNNEVNKVWKETKQLAQFRDNAYREIDETFYFNDVNPNTTFTFCINGESYGVDSLTEAQKADLWRVEKGTNSINVSILKYLYSGKDLPKSLILPLKYKKSDFINDIFKIFNAYVTIDELDEKKLIINSYNEFDSSGNYKDITKLIDSKSIKIEPLSKYIGSGYNFTFGDDNSIYNNDFNDRFNNQPYYKSVNFNNDYSSEVTDVELSSTSTIIRRFNTTTENIFIPVIATSGKFTSEQNHRILFVNNNTGISKYGCYFGTDTNTYISSFLSLSTTYNQNDLSNLDNMVLSFDNNVSYFNDYKTGCNSTIYNKFYINDLENKNTKECRFMTVNANINEYYLNDIKFNDYLLIKSTTYGNSYWRLNAIKNYNPITHNCSLELIKSSRDSKIYNPTVVLNPISLLIPEDSSTTGTGGSSTGGTGTGSSYSKIEIDNFLSLKLDKDVAINKYALINGNILNDFNAKSFIENGVSLSSKYLQAESLIGYAKEAWVSNEIAKLVDSSPSALDTLNELAKALGNDPNFATTVTNLISTKAPLESPNFTGVPTVTGYDVYHAGNFNKPDIPITCSSLTAATGAVIIKGSNYPQVQFTDVANTTRLLFMSGNSLMWRFDGVNDSNVWHSQNSNINTVDWNANNINAYGNININNDWTNDKGLFIKEGGSNEYGAYLLYGLNDELKIGTRDASTTNIDVIKISRGSTNVSIIGNLTTNNGKQVWDAGNSNLPTVDWSVKNLISAGVVKSSNQNGSGFTATGWQIGDYSNLNNLDVRSRLQVYEFVQNKINISNGNLIVTDSAKIESIQDLRPTLSVVRFKFKEEHTFNVGDILRCKTLAKDYFITVNWISADRLIFDTYQNLDAAIANAATGDLLIRWNSNDSNRKGLLYLNSSDTNAPNFQVIYNNTPKAVLGNIAGLNWKGTAIAANKYGVWADGDIYINNGYFSGEVNVTGGNVYDKTQVDYSLSTINTNVTNVSANADTALSNSTTAVNTANTAKSGVDSLNTWKSTIKSLAYLDAVEKSKLGTTIIQGGYILTDLIDAQAIALRQNRFLIPNFGNCLKLNNNEYFKEDNTNGITIYDNAGSGNVSLARVDKDSDTPTGSSYMLTCTIKGSSQSPGYGGFTFSTGTAANHVYVARFVAKVPVGYKIQWASNSIGTGDDSLWLTPNVGTGTYTEYMYKVFAGQSGGFSSTNFFYFTDGPAPSASSPLVIKIAAATVYDTTVEDLKMTKIDANGIYTGTVNCNQINSFVGANLAGWIVNANFIKSPNGKVLIDGNSNSFYVDKPSGGYVMLGQTYVNGNWTGQYGISATNSSNQELFRLDDSCNRIAGWNFDSYHLYSGYMSLNASGAIEHTGGKWALNNNGSGKLAGGNITWNDAGDATFNGTVNASAGNFTGNINALSGKIGGFTISNQNLSTVGNVMTTTLDGLNGTINLVGSGEWNNLTVGIGKYLIPNNGNVNRENFYAAGYFKNNVFISGSGTSNVGLIVEATNGYENTAILTNGKIVSNKGVFSYGVFEVKATAAGGYSSQIPLVGIDCTNIMLINDIANGYEMKLPSVADIERVLAISTTTPFSIDIKIMMHPKSTRDVYVSGGTKYTIVDWNGKPVGNNSFSMAKGDVTVLTINRDSTGYIWASGYVSAK